MPTLRQIEIFLALCEELHFGKTAGKLGIAQSALSMEIKKLEKSVGTALFDRTDKWEIKLTDAGLLYRQTIGDIPLKIVQAQEYAKRASRGEIGLFRLCVASPSCDYFDLGAICHKMLERYPDVKLIVKEVHHIQKITEQVNNGEYDAGIMPFSERISGWVMGNLKYKQVSSFPLYWVLPQDHPLSLKEKIDFIDLKDEPLILPSEEISREFRNYINECFLQNCGHLPHVAYEVDGVKTSRQFVMHGLGITISTREALGDMAGKIVLKQFSTDIVSGNIIVWHKENRSKILSNFLCLL